MSERMTINIDMDKKCVRCKKPGATDGGLCLKCVAKRIKGMSREELLRLSERAR
jgi:hypothetical protein